MSNPHPLTGIILTRFRMRLKPCSDYGVKPYAIGRTFGPRCAARLLTEDPSAGPLLVLRSRSSVLLPQREPDRRTGPRANSTVLEFWSLLRQTCERQNFTREKSGKTKSGGNRSFGRRSGRLSEADRKPAGHHRYGLCLAFTYFARFQKFAA